MTSVLFLTKADDARAARALDFLRKAGADVASHSGHWGSSIPEEIEWWRGDLVISYLARWIVPASVIASAPIAINFHPAPPKYPGIGGTNWALYEGESEFGVTCHKMTAEVDAGPIVAVRRFPIFPADDVESLSERAWDHMLTLFYEVVSALLAGAPLPEPTGETWEGSARTRAELDALATINLGMDEGEAARRIRATAFREYRPQLSILDMHFDLAGPAPHRHRPHLAQFPA